MSEPLVTIGWVTQVSPLRVQWKTAKSDVAATLKDANLPAVSVGDRVEIIREDRYVIVAHKWVSA